jgi:hypothetical protein
MIRVRALIKRRARSLLIGGTLALVCVALAWAHGAPVAHEMDAAGGGDQMADVVSICLAVLQVAGGLLGAAIGAVLVRRWRPPRELGPSTWMSARIYAAPASAAAARASPAALQVFRS